MSDFFDKLKKGAKETGEKASILAKIGGLKAQITNLGVKKNSKLGDLGRKVYTLFTEGKLPDEMLALLKTELDDAVGVDKEVEKLNADIAKLNDDLKKVGVTDQEIQATTAPEAPKPEEPKPEEPTNK
jgi:predicted transcriptional regulator